MTATIASLRESGTLRRVDAALAEWISRACPGASPEALLAAALAARAVADGHSALALDQAQKWLAGLAEGKAPSLPDVGAWCDSLRQSPGVRTLDGSGDAPLVPLVLDAQRYVYLRRYFEYERELALALVARAGAVQAGPHPNLPPQAGKGDGGQAALAVPSPRSRGKVPEGQAGAGRTRANTDAAGPDPEQQRAIATAMARRFTLITGGPGTGKTHSVARILAALAGAAAQRDTVLRIALAAPTGKAAARLTEALQAQRAALALPATVAAQFPHAAATLHRLLGISPWRTQPRFNRAAPLPYDVVVVDEGSMVDLPLMAKLSAAVPDHARLILLGDPGQLAAVEAGNVLGELIAAASNGPLRDCHVTLTRSHRFGTRSALGALAVAITAGDADAALRVLEHGRAVALVTDATPTALIDSAASAYQPVLAASTAGMALQASRGFRVLTALRRGPAGCTALDRAIAARLQRRAGVRMDARWWRGRLIMVTTNRDDLGLFNGDTGVVWPDADGRWQAWFDGPNATPRAFPVASLPSHEGAFALTVHKAQGSEFDRVVLVTGPDSAVLTRELLYTGVTRARESAAVYSTPPVLRAAIARPTVRFTGLADRLREAAAGAGAPPAVVA